MKTVKELVESSDGRMEPLEDLVKDNERLLKEESKKKVTSKLEVGEWFRIDRDVIEKNRKKICCICNEAGDLGKTYWKRFEKSNKIADDIFFRYPRVIETYIFNHDWEYKTEQEMQDMCEQVGDGMCDEIICDLELQMRICNGESAHALFEEDDKLPCGRVIRLRNGEIGYFGGGAIHCNCNPPAFLRSVDFDSNFKDYHFVPYAFRQVLSYH